MKMKKRFFGILLSLVMVLGLIPGMSLTAYAGTSDTGIEVFITDINCEHYKDRTTRFTTDDGLANITFSTTPTFDDEYGWYNPNGDLTITVTAANEDYPISKCMFQCNRPGRADNTDPFEVTITHGGNWNNTTATINDETESSGGLKHIGIFSRITPDFTALSDGMLINLGDKIIPNKYYYRTTGGMIDTDNPEDMADFKQNDLYILVRGNIESRQVDPYDPDSVEDVFVESNNGDHYAFLQVAEKRYIFVGAWTITNHADGLLVTEDTSQNIMSEPVTTYSFSVHEKVINDVTVDSTIENGSIEIKDSEGTAISEAEAGSNVTLDVSANEGYKLKEISAKYLEIQSVSELMEMMGDTKYYAEPNNTEYSDYYKATEDGIKCFLFYDAEKAFLSKTAELDKLKSAEGVYTASGKYENDTDITWKFTVKKGKIIAIALVINEMEYPIKIESTGTIAEPTYASVELTPVTTGEQYTFKMPATDVTVNAVFAEKHTHDGIDFTAWDNATGLPDNAGNYYLTQDVTLSEMWQMPSGTTNLCLNGHNIILKETNTAILCGNPFDEDNSYNLNLYDENNVGSITCDANVTPTMYSIQIQRNGTFTMNGGKITGSKIGAMAIDAGTFVMNGGRITGNSTINNTYDGVKIGGVYCNAGKITMNGGSIADNDGGGVYLDGQSNLTMNGGSITENKGGGVHLKAALLDVQSGAVIIPSAKMSLSGDVTIKNNTVSSANTDVSNVYLEEGTKITLSGALNDNAIVGVTMATPGVFTESTGGAKAKDYADNFTIDNSGYIVATEGDELTMKKPATPATVSANNRTYDGTEKPLVTVTGTATGGTMYYAIGTDDQTAPSEGWDTSIPAKTDVGTYYVWYKVVGDQTHNDTDPVCVKVTIAAPTEPVIAGAALVLDGTLNFRFYVALPEVFDPTGAHMVFTIHGRTVDVPFSEAGIDKDKRTFNCPVYSIEMAEDVAAVFHYTKDSQAKTVTCAASVKDYLDIAQKTYPADTKLLALIAAVRDYGHYIQPYLARIHGFTVGEGGYAAMPAATASLEPATAQDLEPYKTKWNKYDASLVDSVSYYDTFAERTTLHVIVKLKSAKTVTATVDGEPCKVTSLGGRQYSVEIPGIAANNLGKQYRVAFSADGAVICDINVSALTYVRAVLASRNEADETAALTAFYNYYKAAEAYGSN